MDKIQFYLLKKIKKYSSIIEKKAFRSKYSSIIYFATYSNFIGSYILKKLVNLNDNNFFKNLNLIVKDFFFSLNYINCFLYFKKKNKKV